MKRSNRERLQSLLMPERESGTARLEEAVAAYRLEHGSAATSAGQEAGLHGMGAASTSDTPAPGRIRSASVS
jgi:hypothetical protein